MSRHMSTSGRSLNYGVLAVIASMTLTLPLLAQEQWPGKARLQAEQCRAGSGDGRSWLARAEKATGMDRISGALQFVATERESQYYQSDRPYPPFIGMGYTARFSLDPRTGVERSQTLVPGGGTGRDLIRTTKALFGVRGDTLVMPMAPSFHFFAPTLALNPLAVLADWHNAPAVVVGYCRFRDYERVVLSRGVSGERLYLHTISAVPVKYERVEPHFLWGQQLGEYVYATWWEAGPAILPVVSVRYLDGVEQTRRDININVRNVGSDVALTTAIPSLPATLPDHSILPDPQQTASPVDTVRIGANSFLLANPTYNHVVTMARDTVFLFEATTAEWRSRADSTWIATLFPRHRAVVLVVTDLAWPHVAGVRFWVARGAAIATHPLSVPFLTTVVNRAWTVAPDARSSAPMRPVRWITVSRSRQFAGGDVRLAPIDGIGSEGALMAWLPGDRFLWASDYIQNPTAASGYAAEVIAATTREGITPRRVAAQHLQLTDWAQILRVNPAR